MKNYTFTELCEQSLKDNFSFAALTDYGTEKIYTYGDLAREIAALHILFEACHVGPDDKIALIGKNSSRWGIVYLAVITYGAIVVPILQDFNPEDVHHIIEHSDSTYLFSSDSIWETIQANPPETLKGAFSLSSHFQLLFQKENEQIDVLRSGLEEKFAQKYPQGFTKDDIRYTRVTKDKLSILNYTSGTTGFSKGVMITGDNLMGNLVFALHTMPLQQGDKMISMLPLAHAYGGTFELLFPLMQGCTIYFLGKTPSPTILLKAFSEIKPRLVIAVPLILEKMYKSLILPAINKKNMRIALKIPGINSLLYSQIRKKLVQAFGGNFIQLVIGGAPLNSDVEDFLLKIKFPVTVGYGMTECAPLVSFSLSDDYLPHSVGKALPCMEVRIDSSDPYTVAGEIQLKGQNVMLGYYKNEQATEEAFTEDGWLCTGDLGTINKDNTIFIRGRSKNMILSASGQNIYPEEIEAKLMNLPYVLECVVVDRKGRLVAMVYPDYGAIKSEGIDDNELKRIMNHNKDALNSSVASYEKISEIQLSRTEFEKTPKKNIKRYLYQ